MDVASASRPASAAGSCNDYAVNAACTHFLRSTASFGRHGCSSPEGSLRSKRNEGAGSSLSITGTNDETVRAGSSETIVRFVLFRTSATRRSTAFSEARQTPGKAFA